MPAFWHYNHFSRADLKMAKSQLIECYITGSSSSCQSILTLTFLRADEGFFSGVETLMGLQLSALDERFPAVRIIAQIRSFPCNITRKINALVQRKQTWLQDSMWRHWPVCVRLCACNDFSLGKTRLQMLQRMRLVEFSPSLISSLTVSARGRPRRIPSCNNKTH